MNEEEDKRRKMPSSITLEVTADNAQRLRLAEKDGKLSLILRALADRDNSDLPDPADRGDLTRALPPSNFPSLFGFSEAYDEEALRKMGLLSDGSVKKDKILVVRGVKIEEMEITQP